jgi:hypothetical protein
MTDEILKLRTDLNEDIGPFLERQFHLPRNSLTRDCVGDVQKHLREAGAEIRFVFVGEPRYQSSGSYGGRAKPIMLHDQYYSISVKRSVWVALAAVLDVIALQGIASAGLAAVGFTAQVLTRLSEHGGEVCVVRILGAHKNGLVADDLRAKMGRADSFNPLDCKYKAHETQTFRQQTVVTRRCTIDAEALDRVLESLKARGVITQGDDGRYALAF